MDLVESSVVHASLPSLSVPHFLAAAIVRAAQRTRTHLLIVLLADLFDPAHPLSHTAAWNDVQQLLTFVYVQATKVAQDMNRILMNIDVLLLGPHSRLPEPLLAPQLVFRVDGDASPLPASLSSLPKETLPRSPTPALPPNAPPRSDAPDTPSLFPVVALGGTFDHLHAGHKILLSMAAFIASSKLIVGVTSDTLLTRKAHASVLEPLPARTAAVRNFLALFKPGLEADVVPISDVYGPTGWDANIQALVVSKETADGARAIATHRAAHNLPALQTFTIDVISASSTNLSDADANLLKQTKMSSTYIREWIVANGKQ
ncbi:CTP-transf-like domain-containing protein [Mycena venus]|uniref:CTP-transf-like domain-containing protein n=1 Tax=Mycena venus TaxID=2733690 RepID=A0A8H6XCX5_9AGAR|nr:CTP-transf-like domain-containing protein [Mycena venus]